MSRASLQVQQIRHVALSFQQLNCMSSKSSKAWRSSKPPSTCVPLRNLQQTRNSMEAGMEEVKKQDKHRKNLWTAQHIEYETKKKTRWLSASSGHENPWKHTNKNTKYGYVVYHSTSRTSWHARIRNYINDHNRRHSFLIDLLLWWECETWLQIVENIISNECRTVDAEIDLNQENRWPTYTSSANSQEKHEYYLLSILVVTFLLFPWTCPLPTA